MTMVKIITGFDEEKQPRFAYVHPFLAGKRKEELRVPDEIVSRKTGKVRQGWRCVADGALKPVPKHGKKTV